MAATPKTARCTRCGRTLRSSKSVADGMGASCKAKVARAAEKVTSGYQAVQVAKATELIELAAIVRQGPRRVGTFQAVSSRGDAVYTVNQAAHACDCPAGAAGRLCYHLAAADILAAA